MGKYPYINLYAAISIYINTEIELMENGNFHLFAANVKRKQQTSVCFLQTEKQQSTFAISVNVPIYALLILKALSSPLL
jgi:hypothetical protein